MKQGKTGRQCSVHSLSPTRRRVERHCARIPVDSPRDARMPNRRSVTTQGSVGSHKQPQTVLTSPEPALRADAAFSTAASEWYVVLQSERPSIARSSSVVVRSRGRLSLPSQSVFVVPTQGRLPLLGLTQRAGTICSDPDH